MTALTDDFNTMWRKGSQKAGKRGTRPRPRAGGHIAPKRPFIMLIQRHSEICEKKRGSASDLETFVVKGSVDVEGARARMWLVYMYKGPFSGLRCGSR